MNGIEDGGTVELGEYAEKRWKIWILLTSFNFPFKLASVQTPSISTLASGGSDFLRPFPETKQLSS